MHDFSGNQLPVLNYLMNRCCCKARLTNEYTPYKDCVGDAYWSSFVCWSVSTELERSIWWTSWSSRITWCCPVVSSTVMCCRIKNGGNACYILLALSGVRFMSQLLNGRKYCTYTRYRKSGTMLRFEQLCFLVKSVCRGFHHRTWSVYFCSLCWNVRS